MANPSVLMDGERTVACSTANFWLPRLEEFDVFTGNVENTVPTCGLILNGMVSEICVCGVSKPNKHLRVL